MNDNRNKERKLVYYILAYIENKKQSDLESALEWIGKVADYYNVNLKGKKVKTSLYHALIEFLKNNDSMTDNLNRIYSILKQS